MRHRGIIDARLRLKFRGPMVQAIRHHLSLALPPSFIKAQEVPGEVLRGYGKSRVYPHKSTSPHWHIQHAPPF